ncbi:MAG: hypothetical protein EXS05_09070 [Planctomycetaceae bacterium]|nr:hypothetical protein [Planctomycetaceae bacterium]
MKIGQIVLIGGIVWAATWSHAISQTAKLTTPTRAGVFAKLKVGQSVELYSNNAGITSIRIYDDPQQALQHNAKIIELAGDMIALETAAEGEGEDGPAIEYRFPVNAVHTVAHFRAK